MRHLLPLPLTKLVNYTPNTPHLDQNYFQFIFQLYYCNPSPSLMALGQTPYKNNIK